MTDEAEAVPQPQPQTVWHMPGDDTGSETEDEEVHNNDMAIFLTQGPSLQRFVTMPFPDLVAFVRQPNVIRCTSNAIRRVTNIADARTTATTTAAAPMIITRVFLAAYMITCKPTHVFENMDGELEAAVRAASDRLLTAFEGACSAINEGRYADVDGNIGGLFAAYNATFVAWKVPDERRLIARIRHALVALLQARAHLPADLPADNPLIVEFNTQTDRLEHKMRQIAGQEAVDALRAEIAAMAAMDQNNNNNTATAVPNRADPDHFNVKHVYELFLDPSFRLPDDFVSEDPEDIADSNLLTVAAEELSRLPPCYDAVCSIISNIREDLEMQDDNDRIRWGISERVFCIDVFRSLADSILAKESPQRSDAAVAEWAPIRNQLVNAVDVMPPVLVILCINFCTHRLRLMGIDECNKKLALIAPVVAGNGDVYLRQKFDVIFAEGEVSYQKTARWIETVVESNAAAEIDIAASMVVFNKAMVALVSKPPPSDGYPEFFMFDTKRLDDIASEIDSIATSSAVYIFAKAALPVCCTSVSMADALDFAGQITISSADDLIRDINTRFPDIEGSFDKHAKRIFVHDNPTSRVVKRRVLDLFEREFVGNNDIASAVDKLPNAVALLPRIKSAASRLRKLASTNFSILGRRYIQLFEGMGERRAADAAALSALAAMRPARIPQA